jgi:hypothetical protein
VGHAGKEGEEGKAPGFSAAWLLFPCAPAPRLASMELRALAFKS